MLIEALIAHVFADLYCRPTKEDDAFRLTKQPSIHYLWGTSLVYLIILLLNATSFSFYWTALFLLVVLGVSVYDQFLKVRLNRFLDNSLLTNTNQSMHQLYSKNKGILLFLLHQLIKVLWIIIIDHWLSAVRNPLEYLIVIFVSLMIIGFLYYRRNPHFVLNDTSRSNFYQYIALLLVSAAIALFISFLSLEGLNLVGSQGLLTAPFMYPNAYQLFISGVLVLLLLMRPANRMIRLFSLQYDPKEIEKESSVRREDSPASGFKGAGAMIGNLERLLILLSFIFGSLLSIVAILSIKAFARYKLIAEDPYFSEYFVIGTMLSVLITFACYVLFLLLLF